MSHRTRKRAELRRRAKDKESENREAENKNDLMFSIREHVSVDPVGDYYRQYGSLIELTREPGTGGAIDPIFVQLSREEPGDPWSLIISMSHLDYEGSTMDEPEDIEAFFTVWTDIDKRKPKHSNPDWVIRYELRLMGKDNVTRRRVTVAPSLSANVLVSEHQRRKEQNNSA
ncbi:hypothetical protein TREMEDRAFT_61979 [Tremella mesenterica DSM 1558]|uniref:uncharacterized protein n=1 Tax=Tremella mesenterica (strain ATCC 24925 / CBS 8224 / DSM 1558 / NBRC 9311 / NRRL Y-6157 / RJB 2259-6 / UBC 559-6) TaxID=578456 RepID=UPI0003F49D5D|nr:uncharacterized protein TREMEDRAFT_61979 [Tremella mesenterica DSM 1558]EIW70217.1 hypothetical protein TREMEDRAFT_61979 [Tremella mesenterica DSM 1558]